MNRYSAEGTCEVTAYIEAESMEEAEEKLSNGECDFEFGTFDNGGDIVFISGDDEDEGGTK